METVHHIYVDYENVQHIQLPLIAGKPVTVTLVLGSRQDKLPVNLIRDLLSHSPNVRLVETKASSANALDFVLACELGGMCATQPKAAYHIVSKDRGFDAVIDHLRAHGISVHRHGTFEAVPVLDAPQAAPAPPPSPAAKPKPPIPAAEADRVSAVMDWLRKSPKNRPARVKTLGNSINALLQKKLTGAEVDAIIAKLVRSKTISISEKGAVTCHLPGAPQA